MEEIIDSSGQGFQDDEMNHEHNEVRFVVIVIEIHNSSFF